MRLMVRAAMVLAGGMLGAGLFAQQRGTSPLAEQIRAQETVTAQDPGRQDGAAWLKLAILRQDAARYRDSEQAYRRAMALLKRGDRGTLAEAMDRLGTLYAECGEFSRAERLERKALEIRERERDAAGAGISHTHLSVVMLGRREFTRAQAEAELAVRTLVGAPRTTASPEDRMGALINLALARCAGGACASAVPTLESALDIAHRNYGDNSIPVGYLDFLLGYARWKSGDAGAGGQAMRRGTQEMAAQLGWGHPMYVRAMRQYGTFLSEGGHQSEAEEIRARIAKFERPAGTIEAGSLISGSSLR